ncbi:MAG: DNA mismatch repair protein MutH [Deltaproteobacteria bacterium]|nr:MAG: DNA mismatch repair protein MutH [Deltaproteobacteria bacterium]
MTHTIAVAPQATKHPGPLGRRPAPQSVAELLLRAEALEGFTVAQLAAALKLELPLHNRRAKGFVGGLVEQALGADPKARTQPDFPALGVELKTIPIRPDGTPLESTFCCAIAMGRADRASWEASVLRRRLDHVLFVAHLAVKDTPLAARRFARPVLWRPTPPQWQLLQQDWEDLMGKIGAGQSGHLAANVGEILQVRPKAAHRQVRTWGHGPDGPQAVHPLAFYLRARFTRSILRQQG